MAKKILSVVDTAYRATLEEQDDTAVWFSTMCKDAGADITVLLTGNAVNYAVAGARAEPLQFGPGGVPHPPELDGDLKRLTDRGVDVYYMRDDADERGIPAAAIIGEVKPLSRSDLAGFIDHYDMVWHW